MEFSNIISAISGAILTGLITLFGFYINYKNQNKEREFNFNKEKYFYIINKIEFIIGGITHMNINQIQSTTDFINNIDFINKKYEKISSEEIKNIINYTLIYCEKSHSNLTQLVGVYYSIIDALNNKLDNNDIEKKIEIFQNKRRNLLKELTNEIKKIEKNTI